MLSLYIYIYNGMKVIQIDKYKLQKIKNYT